MPTGCAKESFEKSNDSFGSIIFSILLKIQKNKKFLTRKIILLILFKISMKDSIVQQCLDILKREDIKNEFKILLKPIMNFILYEINPYIYIIMSLVFLIFIMILAILIILILIIRNKEVFNK